MGSPTKISVCTLSSVSVKAAAKKEIWFPVGLCDSCCAFDDDTVSTHVGKSRKTIWEQLCRIPVLSKKKFHFGKGDSLLLYPLSLRSPNAKHSRGLLHPPHGCNRRTCHQQQHSRQAKRHRPKPQHCTKIGSKKAGNKLQWNEE